MKQVAWGVRIAYALPAFALAVVGIPIYVYIPKFYTDVIGADITLVGFVLLAVRLFDAVSDPVIGTLSDRTRTCFGRRRPWIAGGVVPLTVAILLLFSPPALGPDAAVIWFGVGMFAVFLFWTAITVPYESLGPELSFDYDERTTILSLRDGMLILGTVIAAASPALVEGMLGLSGDAAGERAKFRAVAIAYAPIIIGACLLCAYMVKERARSRTAAPTSHPLRAMRRLAGNRPFVILLASYTVAAIGSNLPATLIPFYVEYVIGDPDVEKFLLLYFVTGVLLLPLWVRAARHIGKKWAWIVAASINAGTFAGVFFLGRGDVTAYAVLVILSGIGFGATLALPSAMQADVIDYEELRSGQRREGEIIGVWAVSKKLAAAFGVFVAFPILGLAGYEPNVEQSEPVVMALRVLYALVPSLFNLLGLAIALAYPIDREAHLRILSTIDARRRGIDAPDPLVPAP
ncbi:MAG: glycoside-pentoside-hexuronide (GPH):cation symporter [Pseudomonadales bacterium]|jgi:GPH family glycoside/pentoside/hexuronide:cation symporter|nr:glycoside-pentoside-hexuronide (GPH):cation symporter [Pseudomonadales bacterium]